MAENGMRGGPPINAGASNGEHGDHEHNTENDKTPPRLNETAQKYIQQLMAERIQMDSHFPLAVKLIDEALERIQLNGRVPTREQYADVYQQRTIKLSQKVHVPIKDKKFNYVGKLLGPKGNSLRRLQEETQCKIVILGRFSMKDRAREEELRNSADAKYAHLNLPLHVEVSTIAAPAEAYARLAYALAEIRRYLIPDKHDEIRQEQYRELMEDPEAAKKLTIRQMQQQQSNVAGHNTGSGAGTSGNSGNANNRNNGGGNFKPKYQQPSQHYHNDETVYYRSHNNNYHQPKTFVPGGAPRGNPMHATVPPQAIVRASPPGMVVSAPNFNGRMGTSGGTMMPNQATAGGSVSSAGPPNVRYRASAPYPYVKK